MTKTEYLAPAFYFLANCFGRHNILGVGLMTVGLQEGDNWRNEDEKSRRTVIVVIPICWVIVIHYSYQAALITLYHFLSL